MARWRRSLRIKVPRSMVAAEERRALLELARRAKVRGFRKGHLPTALAKRQYGGLAEEDAREAVVRSAFRAAVRERNLNPISQAEVVDLQVNGEAMEFTLEFDVKPEVMVGRSGGFVVEKPVITVTDADVDAALEQLRAKYMESQAAQAPEQETDALPRPQTTDDELAAAAGFAGPEELREGLRADMVDDGERRAEEAVGSRLRQALIDANPFEPPQSMVMGVVEEMLQRRGEGGQQPPEGEDRDELVRQLMPLASNFVRGDLLFNALAQQEGLEADETEIHEIIGKGAAAEGLDAAQAVANARRNGGLAYLRRRLTERNVYRYIRAQSQVIEERTTGDLIAGGRK